MPYKDPQKGIEHSILWAKRNPEKFKLNQERYRLRKRYKTTPDFVKKLAEMQDGKCAICGCSPHGKPLVVDHDHITGKIRGLLCHSCNVAIGHVRENVETLYSMIAYLNKNID